MLCAALSSEADIAGGVVERDGERMVARGVGVEAGNDERRRSHLEVLGHTVK